MPADQDRILADLATMLANFEGREYSAPITRRTRFFADLGFASIDAVILGEKLEARYSQKLPFQRFVTEAMRSQAEDLEVGQLVDFLMNELG